MYLFFLLILNVRFCLSMPNAQHLRNYTCNNFLLISVRFLKSKHHLVEFSYDYNFDKSANLLVRTDFYSLNKYC